MPKGGPRVGAGRKKGLAPVAHLPTRARVAPARPVELERDSSALTELPIPPGHMNEIAKAEWRVTGKLLVDAGVLTARDLSALEGYCLAVANVREAQKQIDNIGILTPADRKNPACAVVQEQMGRMLAFGNELGLSPASRKRLAGSEGGKPKSSFAEF